MVTGGYGDITFEPPVAKILPITNSIAVMTSGDQNIQMQVFQEASKIVGEKISADPSKWIAVSEVTEIYSSCFYKLRNKLIENRVLSQYDLTMDSFISRQKEMSSEFVDMITTNIDRFDVDYMRGQSIETIIAGIDDLGPHIYVAEDGKIDCYDKLGFASVGIGSFHANSHFMLSKYSKFSIESTALLTIHQAKKKSEVSPGVGKETDMCIIGPQKGSFTQLLPFSGLDIVGDLDKFYGRYTKAIDRLNKSTENQIKDYLTQLAPTTQPKQEVSPAPVHKTSLKPPAHQPPKESKKYKAKK
jgi:hypothetical protein